MDKKFCALTEHSLRASSHYNFSGRENLEAGVAIVEIGLSSVVMHYLDQIRHINSNFTHNLDRKLSFQDKRITLDKMKQYIAKQTTHHLL